MAKSSHALLQSEPIGECVRVSININIAHCNISMETIIIIIAGVVG